MTRLSFRAVVLGIAALLAGVPAAPAGAQAAPPPTMRPDRSAVATPIPPGSLAAALATLRPRAGVALAVDADKTPLPAGSEPPGAQPSLTEVADAFGRLTYLCGQVTALGPPTLTVLNTDLHDPQIYDGMPAADALKLLCATLSPPQWQTFTGERGLGQAELSTDDQRALFAACLPRGPLTAQPQGGTPGGRVDITAQRSLIRLRLSAHTDVELPVSDHEWRGGSDPETAGPHYCLSPSGDAPATLYGQTLKTDVPNEPKPGGLDFKQPALRVSVPLAGLKTVGDLVYRIGALTRTEIYADPHYAGRSLATVSSGPTAPAGDLLRALAFCLTATYRPVGPAFVLTDDLLGVGVRRRRVADFATLAQQMRLKPLDAAGDIITAQHGMGDLRGFGGTTDQAPTPEQLKKGQKAEFSADTPGAYLRLSLADLTPAQQAAARRTVEAAAKEPPSGDEQHPPSLEGTLLVVTRPTLTLLVPSLPGPIELIGMNISDSLFRASPETEQKRREATEKAREQAVPPARQTRPTVRPAALAGAGAGGHPAPGGAGGRPDAGADRRRRGGLEDAGVEPALAAGLHGGPCPRPRHAAVGAGGQDRRAGRGPARGRGHGHRRVPRAGLLTWGADAPPEARDLTLTGDVAAPPASAPAPKRLTVSPFAPSVRQSLRALIGAVGAAPGVAGVVWRETAPLGYAARRFTPSGGFGYSLDGRLAFLRAAHADPVDIDDGGTDGDTRLPFWDDAGVSLSDPWNRFRADADEALLRSLLAAWPSTPARPVLVQQRLDSWQGDWFGSWDGPRAPLPAFHQSWERQGNDPVLPDDPAAQAKAQSRLALLRVNRWSANSPNQLAATLAEGMKKRWDGFVLVYDGENGAGLQDLQALAAAHASRPRD